MLRALLICGLLVVVTSPASAEPLAVLMAASGDVSVERSGEGQVPGVFGMHLMDGDVVVTGSNASAEIMFSAGHWIQVDAGSRLGIQGSRGGNRQPAAPSMESVQAFAKLKDERGTSSLALVRSGGESDLDLLTPCKTKVATARPTFRWAASEPVPEVTLTVYDGKGVHWSGDVSGATQFTYPDDAPALEPGVTYTWAVESSDPLMLPPLRSRTELFGILPADEAASVTEALTASSAMEGASSRGQALVRASIYYRHGLLDDAIASTREALEAQPDAHELRSILARLLSETGRTQEALAEYDRLLQSD